MSRITHDEILKKHKHDNLYLTSYGLKEVQRGGAYAYCVGIDSLKQQIKSEMESGEWGQLTLTDYMDIIWLKFRSTISHKINVGGYEIIKVKEPEDIREARNEECYYGSYEVVDKKPTQIELLTELNEALQTAWTHADDMFLCRQNPMDIENISGYSTFKELKYWYKHTQNEANKLKAEYETACKENKWV